VEVEDGGLETSLLARLGLKRLDSPGKCLVLLPLILKLLVLVFELLVLVLNDLVLVFELLAFVLKRLPHLFH